VVEVDDVVISVEVVAVVEGKSGETATSSGVVQAARPAITSTIAILILGRVRRHHRSPIRPMTLDGCT
jgi:hypothetical protein